MSEATVSTQAGAPTIFDMYDALQSKSYRPGQLVLGLVGESDDTWTSVSVSDATAKISLEESTGLKVGDEAHFFIDELDGETLILSQHKADRLRLWNWLEHVRETGEAVQATVVGESRGDIALDLYGVKVTMPSRDLATDRPKDIAALKGEVLEVRVVKLREKKAQIVVSERALAEGDPVVRKAATLDSLKEGQVVEGEVRRFANFGAFVDIGGIDGLLHVKDIQWKRVGHPADVLAIGDVLDLKVLRFDRESEKIALGLKQMRPDPWEDASDRYPEGMAVSGDVVGLTEFGAFVMMDDGIEGLIHVSEMSWTEKVAKPSDVLSKGKNVTAWVVRCEMDRKRLGLTLRDPAENPWRKVADANPVGSTLSTKVTSVAEFGIFVDLGLGLEGLVHTSDFSWTPLTESPSGLYTVGQELDVMVLDVDVDRGRANLGIKQLSEDLTVELMSKYSTGQQLNVTVTSILSYGVFAQLEPGLEGLIHVSELGREVEDPSDMVSAGQVISVEVINIESDEGRVSLRLLNLTPSEAAAEEPAAEAAAEEPAAEAAAEEPAAEAAAEEPAAEAAAEETAAEAAAEEPETKED